MYMYIYVHIHICIYRLYDIHIALNKIPMLEASQLSFPEKDLRARSIMSRHVVSVRHTFSKVFSWHLCTTIGKKQN